MTSYLSAFREDHAAFVGNVLSHFGGNEVTNPFMVTEVYVRQDGKWQLAQLSFSVLRGN